MDEIQGLVFVPCSLCNDDPKVYYRADTNDYVCVHNCVQDNSIMLHDKVLYDVMYQWRDVQPKCPKCGSVACPDCELKKL